MSACYPRTLTSGLAYLSPAASISPYSRQTSAFRSSMGNAGPTSCGGAADLAALLDTRGRRAGLSTSEEMLDGYSRA